MGGASTVIVWNAVLGLRLQAESPPRSCPDHRAVGVRVEGCWVGYRLSGSSGRRSKWGRAYSSLTLRMRPSLQSTVTHRDWTPKSGTSAAASRGIVHPHESGRRRARRV